MTDDTDGPALKECDLIMKGGITSGIVYPSAILRLKREYRFRSIGGASAGAIAAAFAAAAELGRADAGFDKLQTRREQLASGTFLKDLFQPTEGTRPVLDAGYDAMLLRADLAAARRQGRVGRGRWAAARFLAPRLLRLVWRNARPGSIRGGATALAAAAGIGLVAALALAAAGRLLGVEVTWGVLALGALLTVLVLGLPASPIGALAGGAAELGRRLTVEVPANLFGVCHGGPGEPGKPSLTQWIHDSVQDLAGRADAAPLTFGDLERSGIHLRMMTTNLSHNQGYRLPGFGGSDDAADAGPRVSFVFRDEEFRRLFPGSVVDAMVAASAMEVDGLRLPAGYYALPRGTDLPVVVATRMSLSFPVLLSAIPLYTVGRDALDRSRHRGTAGLVAGDLQRNWFSDGGIASNFPIHFFDNWLPGRPTFGIQLTDLPPDGLEPTEGPSTATVAGRYRSAVTHAADGTGVDKAVYLPRGDDVLEPEWHPIEGWVGFAMAIFTTLHEAHDNLLSSLPGYRERVVQVRLASNEGGLNLAMSTRTIEQVMAKGEAAGDKILQYFDMNEHRWVRFRVLMAELERNLGLLEQRLAARQFDVDGLLTKVAEPVPEGARGFPYPRDCAWCEAARLRTADVRALAQKWATGTLFGLSTPQPLPVLRAAPRD